MHKTDLKIIRSIKDNNIEFCANTSLEPNSSYEIENCINETIGPLQEINYRFDYWFDDNDTGYFIKDNIRVDIHYGVMFDFNFTIENKYSELDLNKIENWIKDVYLCMLQKEKIRIENSNEENKQNFESAEIKKIEFIEAEKEGIKESYLRSLLKKILRKK